MPSLVLFLGGKYPGDGPIRRRKKYWQDGIENKKWIC